MSAWLCWASAFNETSEDAPGESAASGPSGPSGSSGRLLPGTSHGGVTLVVTLRMGTQIAPPGFLKPSLICPQSFSAPRASLTSELLSIGSGTVNSAPEMTLLETAGCALQMQNAAASRSVREEKLVLARARRWKSAGRGALGVVARRLACSL